MERDGDHVKTKEQSENDKDIYAKKSLASTSH